MVSSLFFTLTLSQGDGNDLLSMNENNAWLFEVLSVNPCDIPFAELMK